MSSVWVEELQTISWVFSSDFMLAQPVCDTLVYTVLEENGPRGVVTWTEQDMYWTGLGPGPGLDSTQTLSIQVPPEAETEEVLKLQYIALNLIQYNFAALLTTLTVNLRMVNKVLGKVWEVQLKCLTCFDATGCLNFPWDQ